jgi:isoamylase
MKKCLSVLCPAGFTAHPSSAVQAPGTYLGLIEKLDYLKSLGVNAIELLPVFEFNELEYYSPIPGSPTNEHRFNFWGYSTGVQQRTSHTVSTVRGMCC